ncbi:MAG: hypothetical protein DSY80_09460 [Desulfocapsa sp.]|nr:MAG: hypothetical protein DSY80_09460 [Desulfocapsa sp.]
MLQLKSIHPETFALLKELAAKKDLDCFALAGGTALALQLGHRISIDLDFFTSKKFEGRGLSEILAENFELRDCSTGLNSLSCYISYQQRSAVKTDFIRHNYPLLKPLITSEGIRIFSLEDIAAMKLNAVTNRGAKKDFYDIHALFNIFSLKELLGFFEAKYRNMNNFTVVKSLTYFDDADMEPAPVSLTKISWEKIKADIIATIRDFI